MHIFNLCIQQFVHLKQSLLPCSLCGMHDRFSTFSVCQHCLNELPWHIDHVQRYEQQILVACSYQYPVNRILQQFKYEQQLHYLPLLCDVMQHLLARLKHDHIQTPIQAVVPMPISVQRLKERGYNQSLLLAKYLAKQLHCPIWQPIERCEQFSQKGLNRLERIQDIEQQFVIKPKLKIHYRNVLIVDDIVTTGSSIAALKEKLQQLGCTHIASCCIAATMRC